jgi:hypothetical protein
MQLIPRYLVKNRIDVVLDVTGFATEYKPVYQRQINIYRGIDNNVQFRMFNADQKPVSIAGRTPRLHAFDENKNLVLDIDGVVLDDGSTRRTQGMFTITVTENDLLNINQQYLSYTVFLIDDDTHDRSITYSDPHFNNPGVMYISAQAFPSVKPPLEIKQFQKTDFITDRWVSETASAEPNINSNEALHTIVIYTNGFIGSLTLQATLNQQLNEGGSWSDIETIEFTGAETEPTAINVVGVFKYFRFITFDDPVNITKILIKN